MATKRFDWRAGPDKPIDPSTIRLWGMGYGLQEYSWDKILPPAQEEALWARVDQVEAAYLAAQPAETEVTAPADALGRWPEAMQAQRDLARRSASYVKATGRAPVHCFAYISAEHMVRTVKDHVRLLGGHPIEVLGLEDHGLPHSFYLGRDFIHKGNVSKFASVIGQLSDVMLPGAPLVLTHCLVLCDPKEVIPKNITMHEHGAWVIKKSPPRKHIDAGPLQIVQRALGRPIIACRDTQWSANQRLDGPAYLINETGATLLAGGDDSLPASVRGVLQFD